MEDLGLPELTNEQIKELCIVAEAAAKKPWNKTLFFPRARKFLVQLALAEETANSAAARKENLK